MTMNSIERFSKQDVEDIIAMVRLELYNRGVPCGLAAIRKKIEQDHHVLPLPKKSMISRVLSERCLTHQRTGWYAEDSPQSVSQGKENEG